MAVLAAALAAMVAQALALERLVKDTMVALEVALRMPLAAAAEPQQQAGMPQATIMVERLAQARLAALRAAL